MDGEYRPAVVIADIQLAKKTFHQNGWHGSHPGPMITAYSLILKISHPRKVCDLAQLARMKNGAATQLK